MWNFPNHEFARLDIRTLHLNMALQAQVIVAFDQQHPVDRTMGIVARGASFAQRLVLEDEWPALLAMTLRAILIQSRHRESARWFHDIVSVRVVALHTVHHPFDNRMMLWQTKLRVHIHVTLETGARVLSRIHNQPPSTTYPDVLARRPVARFASGG